MQPHRCNNILFLPRRDGHIWAKRQQTYFHSLDLNVTQCHMFIRVNCISDSGRGKGEATMASSVEAVQLSFDDVYNDLRMRVVDLPPRTNLGRLWQLAHHYGVSTIKLSRILRRLIEEGWIVPKSGLYGGYFTPSRRRASVRRHPGTPKPN